jgi:hypothetical protein
MKHFVHLLVWEFRRSRSLLAVWLLLVAANAAFAAAWPTLAASRSTRELLGTAGDLMFIAGNLVGVMMIAYVVQADALVGTRAFWMTRPIPRGALLAAKLTFLGATVIVPKVAAEAVLMAVHHVPVADLLGVSAYTALSWSLWTAVLMSAAAMTRTLAHLALLTGGALVLLAVTIAVMFAFAMKRFEEVPPLSADGVASYDPTASIVTTALIVIAALALLVAQYLTRRRVLSAAVGSVGLLAAYAIAAAWRWPLLAPGAVTPPWGANPAMLALDASSDSVTLERGMWILDQPNDWKEARAQIRVRGLEPGWTASPALRRATVQVPGKPELISPFAAHPAAVLAENGDQPQHRDVMRRLLEVDSLIDAQAAEDRGENAIIMFARSSEIGRLGAARGSYDGRFQVALTHHVVDGVLTIRPYATHQSGPYRFAIRAIQSESEQLSLTAEESAAVSVFARSPRTTRTFYLRNRRVSQAVLGSSFPIRETSLLRVLPFVSGFGVENSPGFTIQAQTVNFPPAARRAPIVLDETWLRDAELVVVKSTEEGSVSRQLSIPDFPIR